MPLPLILIFLNLNLPIHKIIFPRVVKWQRVDQKVPYNLLRKWSIKHKYFFSWAKIRKQILWKSCLTTAAIAKATCYLLFCSPWVPFLETLDVLCIFLFRDSGCPGIRIVRALGVMNTTGQTIRSASTIPASTTLIQALMEISVPCTANIINKNSTQWVWVWRPLTPVLKSQRWEDCSDFEARWSYRVNSKSVRVRVSPSSSQNQNQTKTHRTKPEDLGDGSVGKSACSY